MTECVILMGDWRDVPVLLPQGTETGRDIRKVEAGRGRDRHSKGEDGAQRRLRTLASRCQSSGARAVLSFFKISNSKSLIRLDGLTIHDKKRRLETIRIIHIKIADRIRT